MMKKSLDVLGWYMDKFLFNYLLNLRNQVETKDFDGVIIIDGYEGYGKSCLSTQVNYVLNPDIDKWWPIFNLQQFKEAVDKANKGDVLWIDESRRFTAAQKRALNQTVLDELAVIRRKNLFLVWVMPSFMEIVAALAVWRAKCLIHVYSPGNYKRGYFKFFGMNEKRMLYFKGKKKYFDYKVVKGLRGTFIHRWCYPHDEYKLLKEKGLEMPDRAEGDGKNYWKEKYEEVIEQRNSLIGCLHYNYGVTHKYIANWLDVKRPTITDICQRVGRRKE